MTKERTFFLFNDLLLIAKEKDKEDKESCHYKLKTMCPVLSLTVEDEVREEEYGLSYSARFGQSSASLIQTRDMCFGLHGTRSVEKGKKKKLLSVIVICSSAGSAKEWTNLIRDAREKESGVSSKTIMRIHKRDEEEENEKEENEDDVVIDKTLKKKKTDKLKRHSVQRKGFDTKGVRPIKRKNAENMESTESFEAIHSVDEEKEIANRRISFDRITEEPNKATCVTNSINDSLSIESPRVKVSLKVNFQDNSETTSNDAEDKQQSEANSDNKWKRFRKSLSLGNFKKGAELTVGEHNEVLLFSDSDVDLTNVSANLEAGGKTKAHTERKISNDSNENNGTRSKAKKKQDTAKDNHHQNNIKSSDPPQQSLADKLHKLKVEVPSPNLTQSASSVKTRSSFMSLLSPRLRDKSQRSKSSSMELVEKDKNLIDRESKAPGTKRKKTKTKAEKEEKKVSEKARNAGNELDSALPDEKEKKMMASTPSPLRLTPLTNRERRRSVNAAYSPDNMWIDLRSVHTEKGKYHHLLTAKRRSRTFIPDVQSPPQDSQEEQEEKEKQATTTTTTTTTTTKELEQASRDSPRNCTKKSRDRASTTKEKVGKDLMGKDGPGEGKEKGRKQEEGEQEKQKDESKKGSERMASKDDKLIKRKNKASGSRRVSREGHEHDKEIDSEKEECSSSRAEQLGTEHLYLHHHDVDVDVENGGGGRVATEGRESSEATTTRRVPLRRVRSTSLDRRHTLVTNQPTN